MWNFACMFVPALVALVGAQNNVYIWDLLPTPLDAAEITRMLETAMPGESFPAFNTAPNTSFSCKDQKLPGYYADPDAGCQVIRRCPPLGEMSSYLCPNYTLFNQITLTCDWWFNVDCSKAREFYSFAVPRLYQTKMKMYDTPPKSYVAPYFRKIEAEQRAMIEKQKQGGGSGSGEQDDQQPMAAMSQPMKMNRKAKQSGRPMMSTTTTTEASMTEDDAAMESS